MYSLVYLFMKKATLCYKFTNFSSTNANYGLLRYPRKYFGSTSPSLTKTGVFKLLGGKKNSVIVRTSKPLPFYCSVIVIIISLDLTAFWELTQKIQPGGPDCSARG